MKLPFALKPLEKRLEATIKPYLKITPSYSNNLSLWESKFGGYPYFPKSLQYPHNPQGQPLTLLTQLNFSEIATLKGFPTKGILQFYIDSHHDLYGFNEDDMTDQSHFRIIYFEEIEQNETALITDFSFLPNLDDLETFLPFIGSFALSFEQKKEPISGCDYQLEKLIEDFVDNQAEALDYCDLLDDYLDFYDGEDHKIGGYPFFTQDDPRLQLTDTIEPYQLLFQMISDDEADIMWGDAGVGNFFIQPSALETLDFSRVIYYYDCA